MQLFIHATTKFQTYNQKGPLVYEINILSSDSAMAIYSFWHNLNNTEYDIYIYIYIYSSGDFE